jgi:preprotein translocase subunit SecG
MVIILSVFFLWVCIFICLLVSGNESDNESESSTEDDAESIQSQEADIGLKSLLDDDNQDDDEMNIKKVCRPVCLLSKT